MHEGPLPSRVLMTTDAVGGVWTYSLELARALDRHGIEVILATMGPLPTDRQRSEAARIGNIVLRESEHRLEWMDDPWEDVDRAGDWLLALEEETGPDVVHLNGYAHGALSWKAPHLVVGHSCVFSWWRAVKGEPPPSSWETYRRKVAAGLAGADAVVAPTVAMLRSLEQNYLPLPEKLAVHNGRSGRDLVPEKKEEVILAAGRIWDEAKNFPALDAAAAGISWPVLFAGDAEGPGRKRVRIRNALHLGTLGSSLLAERLRRAAIYALPARYEPFGLSVLEAGLCGCALVLGDIPTLRELWNGAAVFVPPDDVDGLRKALETLCRDGTRRTDLGRRARSRALLYTPEKKAASYLRLYSLLIERCTSTSGEIPSCGSSFSTIPSSPTGTTATPTS